MKIALYNIEPKIDNVALMRIASYHKSIGDEVEWYIDFNRDRYDKVYCSSLFDYTDKSGVPKNAICGGTGFDDIGKKLPDEIECCDLGYSIYPDCEKSYVWFSRGCVRNCPFCVVREKEGYMHRVDPYNLNPNGKVIDIMDNNFFANPNWKDAEKYLEQWGLPISFRSGIDVRLFDPSHAEFIRKYIKKTYGSVHIAWDNPREDLIPQIKLISKHLRKYYITCYILIGYWSSPEEDLMRAMKLKEIGIQPFVMPFNKKDEYQRAFARWVNSPRIFKTVSWEGYKYNKKGDNSGINKRVI